MAVLARRFAVVMMIETRDAKVLNATSFFRVLCRDGIRPQWPAPVGNIVTDTDMKIKLGSMDSPTECGEMQPVTFQVPTRISFGPDTAGGVGALVKEFGGKKTFIVADANLIKARALTPIFESLQRSNWPEPVGFDPI